MHSWLVQPQSSMHSWFTWTESSCVVSRDMWYGIVYYSVLQSAYDASWVVHDPLSELEVFMDTVLVLVGTTTKALCLPGWPNQEDIMPPWLVQPTTNSAFWLNQPGINSALWLAQPGNNSLSWLDQPESIVASWFFGRCFLKNVEMI